MAYVIITRIINFFRNLLLPVRALSVIAVLGWSLIGARAGGSPMLVTGSFDNPPYSYIGDAGEACGYDVDLLKAAAAHAGFGVKFAVSEWTERSEGQVQLASAIEEGTARQRFSRPVGLRRSAVFARKGALIRGLEDLQSGEKVAVVEGSAVDDYLFKIGIEKLERMRDVRSAMRAVGEGKAKAAVVDCVAGTLLAEDAGEWEQKGEAFMGREFAFSVSDEGTRKLLDEGLRAVERTGQRERLEEQWLRTPAKSHAAMLIAFGKWVILPLLLLFGAAAYQASGQRRKAARRIVALERELSAGRMRVRELEHERAVQQYVMNQLSTVTLVDQLVDVSQSRFDQ